MAAIALGGATSLLRPGPAEACSIIGLTPETLDTWAGLSTVVAVGTFENPEKEVVTLRVEEYLKGDETAPMLRVNNYRLDVCYRGLIGTGHYHQAGERVLVFLEPDTYDIDADWESVAGDATILEIYGDELAYYTNVTAENLTYAEAREAILAVRDDPRVPTPETPWGQGCGWMGAYDAAGLGSSTVAADLVVRGTIRGAVGDVATLEVSEYLRGRGPGELRVSNRRLIPDAQTCLTGLGGGPAYRDWRPTGQGQAVLEVEGDLLDYPTMVGQGLVRLSEVHAALGPSRAPDPGAVDPVVKVVEPGDDGWNWPLWGNAALVMLAVALSAGGWLWLRLARGP
ncbi:MAG: hypothetical protein WD557_18045 [Dehalococcoidia bacterium]